MWIVVCGPTGSGKHFVVEALQKEGYEFLNEPVVPDPAEPLETEIKFMLSRAKTQIQASKVRNRKDVITMRTFFESRDIYIPRSHELTYLNEKDMKLLNLMSGVFADDVFDPPHVLITMKTPMWSALDRAKLRGIPLSDQEFKYQEAAYNKWLENVRVPIVEIDASKRADLILKDIEFNIASIKAAELGGSSVWQKTFFRG
jgi:deoxyadenosine/deoxycytidine kinase